MYHLYTLQYNVHVPCVLWWCDGYHIRLAIKSLLHVHIMTLGKLFTHMWLCHQAV